MNGRVVRGRMVDVMEQALYKLDDFEVYQETRQFRKKANSVIKKLSSVEEIIYDFNVCIDENYCRGMNVDKLKEDEYELVMRINSYISYLRKSKQGEA